MVANGHPNDPSPYRPVSPFSDGPTYGFTERSRRRSSLRKSFVDFSSSEEEDDKLSPYVPDSKDHWTPEKASLYRNMSSSGRSGRPKFNLCSACKLEAINSQVISINEKININYLNDHNLELINRSPVSSEITPSLVSTSTIELAQNHHGRELPSLSLPPLLPNDQPSFGSAYYRKMSFGSGIRERRRSLVGSYEESLFSGRMSAPSSSPIPFFVKIGALEHCTDPKKIPQCFRQEKIQFEAVFYKLGEAGEETPYVGEVNIRQHYKAKYKADDMACATVLQKNCKRQINFPGYKVSARGQFQFIISNSEKTAFKVLLVPYDLTDMPRKSKTFIRQKVFLLEDPKSAPNAKGSLVQAVHIPVACPSTGKYYIYGQVRLVFSNRRSSTTSEESVAKACLTHAKMPSLPREGGETVSSTYSELGVPVSEITEYIDGVDSSVATALAECGKNHYPEKSYLGVTKRRECVRVETMVGGWTPFSLRGERDNHTKLNYSIGDESNITSTDIRCTGCKNIII